MRPDQTTNLGVRSSNLFGRAIILSAISKIYVVLRFGTLLTPRLDGNHLATRNAQLRAWSSNAFEGHTMSQRQPEIT